MISNLPSELPKLLLYKGQPFTLKLGFPEAYPFSSPTARVQLGSNGKALPDAQQPDVEPVGRFLHITFPQALTEVRHPLLAVRISNGGEALLGGSIEIADRTQDSPDSQTYEVTVSGGVVVEVNVSDLALGAQYATQAQQAAIQTAQDAITTGADAEAVELARQDVADKSDTIATQHGQVQGWWQNVSDWRTTIQGWYNSVQGWFGQIQTWVTNINTQHGQIQGWHGEVDADAQAVEIARQQVATNTTISTNAATSASASAATALSVSQAGRAHLNGNRTNSTIRRVAFGIDSHTANLYSYVTQLTGVGNSADNGGAWVSLLDTNVSNLTGFTPLAAVGNRGVVPRTYSLDGFGLTLAAGSNAGFRHLPLVTSGVQMGWKKVRLFYLSQPGGGTFKFRQYASDGSSGAATTVDTNAGAVTINFVELSVTTTCNQAFTEVYEAAGPVTIFGLLYNTGTSWTDHYYTMRLAQGGSSVQDWNRLNKTTLARWYELLDLDLYIFNGGTNDRITRTASDLQADMTAYLSAIKNATNGPDIIVIEPTQTSDYATTYAKDYAAVYQSVAYTGKYGYVSMPALLGDFSTVQATYGMEVENPVVHLTAAANRTFGYQISPLIGLNKPNATLPTYGAGAGSVVDLYAVDFSTWKSDAKNLTSGVPATVIEIGAAGPFCEGWMDIEVTVRVAQGVRYFVTRLYRVYLRSITGSANIVELSEIANTETARYAAGGWSTLALTLTNDISSGTFKLNASANFNTNVFVRVKDMRVTLNASGKTAFNLVSII